MSETNQENATKVSGISEDKASEIARKHASDVDAKLAKELEAYKAQLAEEKANREALLKEQEELRKRLEEIDRKTVKLPEQEKEHVDPVEVLSRQLAEQSAALKALQESLANKKDPDIETSLKNFREELARKELDEYRASVSNKLRFPDRLTGKTKAEIDANLAKLQEEEKAFAAQIEADVRKQLPAFGPIKSGKPNSAMPQEKFNEATKKYRHMTMEELKEIQRKRLETKLGG
jgi:hypothetical protein